MLRTFRCHLGAVSGVPASLALGCIDVRRAWAKLLASTTSCIKLAIDIGPGVQSAESASHDLVEKEAGYAKVMVESWTFLWLVILVPPVWVTHRRPLRSLHLQGEDT